MYRGTYTLIGQEMSMFTRKLEAQLRYQQIPYQFVGKRKGDLSTSYADPSKALKELRWKAKKGLTEMCEDSYKWVCSEKYKK